ncbi:hypothetical protein CF326_g6237 [Tilletia indica]|nr:hypothetical protein CF326_g6237 [Tilletia indica]
MAMVDPSSSRTAAASSAPLTPRANADPALFSPPPPPPAPSNPTTAQQVGPTPATPTATTFAAAVPSTPGAATGSQFHNDKAPTKKKQLGNWLFKKFGGSGTRSGHHQQQHSFDSAHENGGEPTTENAGTFASPSGAVGVNGSSTAASSSRHRRPSFPRSRRGTNTAPPEPAPDSGGVNGLNIGAGVEPPLPSSSKTTSSSLGRKLGSSIIRPSSADAKSSSGPGGGGVVSSFWRASHIDGVPTPSLPKNEKGKGIAVTTGPSSKDPPFLAGAGQDVRTTSSGRHTASSSGVTDTLEDTLILPPTPSVAGDKAASTRGILDGVEATTSDTIEPAHLRAGMLASDRHSPSLDPENRTAASSPAPSQTAFSIGTTSLGTDTSAPASSINSLVRIRNGTDLRNNGTAVNGLVGGGGIAGSSRLNTDGALGTDVLDIPDGSTDNHHSDSDSDSDSASDRAWRRRYSGDNATMDTGKSVSTKPTTVMSLDTRDASGGPGMMAHIAQYRHGDPTSPSFGAQSSNPIGSRSYSRHSQLGPNSIQFADQLTPAAQFIRSTSAAAAAANGTAFPGQGQTVEDAGPFVNVPSFSRPHPFNNPAPQGIPADNASMLTLASSTAAQSIMGPSHGGLSGGGGMTPSIRTHGRAPSVATRSLGGSLMGDRRNSSDTYASLKALPPLSRRGSDASTRTGLESFAPSVSQGGIGEVPAGPGRSAGGAGGGVAVSALGGPGAPIDRVASLHRSPSMRTVNTQLSVPLSLAAAYQGAPAPASSSLSTGISINGHLGGTSTGGGGASPLESGSPGGRPHSGADLVMAAPGSVGGGIVP